MGQAVREPRASLLDVSARPSVQPHTQRSRSLRLLQIGLAAGDLVVILLATVLAAYGRTHLDLFKATLDINELTASFHHAP